MEVLVIQINVFVVENKIDGPIWKVNRVFREVSRHFLFVFHAFFIFFVLLLLLFGVPALACLQFRPHLVEFVFKSDFVGVDHPQFGVELKIVEHFICVLVLERSY